MKEQLDQHKILDEDNYNVKKKSINIKRGLKEIFNFYCKQQQLVGRNHTFGDLYSASQNMTIGEFMNFCKNFYIPITLEEVKNQFKKRGGLKAQISWDVFIVY